MNDTCLTITRVSRAELRVQGSRFIATAAPAATVEAAMALLEDVRNEFHDCTHTCFAYRIGPNGEHHRSSDGGEPSGSAGKPIMRAIEHRGLTDLVVTVTRYFGGTKLGVGNLARAYGACAERGLARAAITERVLLELLHAAFPHAMTGEVMAVAARTGARVKDTRYDEEVHLWLEIRRSRLEELRSGLVDRTSGNIRFLATGSLP